MKKLISLSFLFVTLQGMGRQLPGFGLTYLNFIDPVNNTGDDSIQQTQWKKINIDSLNAPLIRQMQNRDLTWDYMEMPNNDFHFLKADTLILMNPTSQFIGTLFHENGAKDTLNLSPWGSNSSADRINYVTVVVNHYKNSVNFWEIGNENSHSWKKGNFSPAQYAALLQEISPIVYAADTNSKIIISGLGNPEDQWNLNDSNMIWLDSVLLNSGNNPGQYFDIIDCHLYIEWFRIPVFVRKIQSVLNQYGCNNKLIMVGENGISGDYSNTWPLAGVGTKNQAQQVFTRMCLAVGSGASHSSWFSHIDDFGNNGNFHGYGSVYHTTTGVIAQKPSWYSLQLLYNELVNFSGVEMISEGDSLTGSGDYVIKFTVGGIEKYVAWNVNGSNYTLTGLTGNTAQIIHTVCNTSIQTIGSLTDQWPVLTNNNPAFQTTAQNIISGNLNLTLSATPLLITINNVSGIEQTNYYMQNLKFFPNPFSKQSVLQTGNSLNHATLTVYNAYGRQVKQIKNISGQTVVLSGDNLPCGLYLVRLAESNHIIATDKLLITD